MKHYNHVTGKEYEGRNQVILAIAGKDYASNAWLTFIQARNANLKIKKGSKGVTICLGFGSFSEEKEVNGKKETKTYTRPLGFARVFNLDQTEPMKAKQTA